MAIIHFHQLREEFQTAARNTVDDAIDLLLAARGDSSPGHPQTMMIPPQLIDTLAVQVSAAIAVKTRTHDLDSPFTVRDTFESAKSIAKDLILQSKKIIPQFVGPVKFESV